MILLLMSLLPAIAISLVAYNKMFETIRSERIKDVGRVADGKHDQLVMVLTRTRIKTEHFLSDLSAQCSGNASRLNYICATGLIKTYLTEEGAIGATLRKKGGDSLTIGNSATRNKEPDAFQPKQLAKLSGTGTDNNRSFFVSVAEKATGLQLEITYASSMLEPVFNSIPADLGHSGETFLADGEGFFVTRPRYESTQGHKHPITARPMQSCLSGQSDEMLDLDYRDVDIIHGFRFVQELGSACIMAHISQAEAFGPLKALEQKIIIGVFLFGTFLVITAVYLARRFVRPISKLTNTTHIIAAGDYTAKADVEGSDEISELAVSFNEMTDRLQASQRRLLQVEVDKERERLFNLSIDMLCVAGFDGYFKQLNPAWEKTLGWTNEELMSKPYIEFIHPLDLQATIDAAEGLAHNIKVVSFENRYLCKDGSFKWLSWNSVPLIEEELVFAVARDISKNKEEEGAIKRLNKELASRASELESVNKELETFSYSVSHDLRAPLRSLTGFSEMLAKRAAGTLDEKNMHYLNVISESARQMGRLIDDLLSFSRMGREEMMKTVVSIDRLVKATVKELEAEAKQGVIVWEIRQMPDVYGDPSMLKLVVVNLVSNALKFSRTRPQVKIEIGCVPDGEDETIFYVRDNGVGFNMKYADKLFGIFQRLHRQDEFEGTGIGLANVKRIIQRHGGRVWAEGKVNEGATFYFTLQNKGGGYERSVKENTSGRG